MGLFDRPPPLSGAKNSFKYHAYAASQSLYEEKKPDTFLNELIQASIIEPRTMGDAVNITLNTDHFARARALFRYARKYEDPEREGGYVRGLPTSNLSVVAVNPADVEAALTRAVGEYDSIHRVLSSRYDETFFVSRAIQAAWPEGHWDELQEEITIPGTTITTLNDPDYIRIGGDPGSIDESLRDILGPDGWAKYILTQMFDGDYYVEWTYLDGETEKTYILEIDIGDYLEGLYVMVRYFIGEQLFYWVYDLDSGLDPEFEAAIDKREDEAQFLPVIMMMQDKVWYDENEDGSDASDTELAKTTRSIVRKLGTSARKMKDEFIAQQEDDDNSKDLKKAKTEVWDFLVHYAIPIDTRVRGAKEYLWTFFTYLENWQDYTADDYLNYLDSEVTEGKGDYTKAQPVNELIIKEAGDTGYHVAYRWSYIKTEYFEGEYIIDDPTVEEGERPLKPKEIISNLYEAPKGDPDPNDFNTREEYLRDVELMFGEDTRIGVGSGKEYSNSDTGYHDYASFTRATDDGLGYEKMILMGLSMEYKINTRDTEKGKKGYRFKYAEPKLFGTDEETREFRIPIMYAAIKDIPAMHREEAIVEGLSATVFLVQKEKVLWYQTGFFKWLMIIVAIVLTIISIFYPAVWKAAAAAWSAALGGGAFLAFILYVVIIFAVGYTIGLGLSLMSRGMRLAFMIIIFIVALYTGQLQTMMKGAWKNLKTAPGWGTAMAFISAISPIYNLGMEIYTYDRVSHYKREYEDLLEDKAEFEEQLKDAYASFGDIPSWLDPLDLVAAHNLQAQYERADEYYQRTLMANPGELGYALVRDFAEIGVSLPRTAGEPSVVDGVIRDFGDQRRQT